MTKRILAIIIAICCLTTSCKDKVEATVAGCWSIDTLIYRNYEIRTCLLGNWLEFNKDGSIDLPVPENRCSELVTDYNSKGGWEIMRQDSIPLSLKVDSKNIIFKGTHQIIFRNDTENGLLKMEIKSDSLYVLCRKGLFDYERKQKLIDELERASKGEE